MPNCPSCGATLRAGATDCARCATRVAGAGSLATVTVAPAAAPTLTEDQGPTRAAAPKRIAHFTITRELGMGGMGTVYLAHDEKMDRAVALKVLARHQISEKAGKRFEQEAWIAGRLDHPNLVKVYERGVWEDLSYFSMELVDGGSLGDVIQNLRRGGRDERWGLEFGSSRYVHWAIGMVIDAARGLDFAHRQGVVHRDVKPMNLLLSRDPPAVKIADFGLAIDAEVTRMTTVGTVMGTISFMAPEQIRGEQRLIGASSDVYALGVTLFELLTLELPYSGQTQQIYMSQVLTAEARRASKLNSRVSRDLETVLLRAMEKEPRHRYPTAAAFADDLDNVLHLRPITAKPSGAGKRAVKWVRRKPVHAALLATLAVSVPLVALVGIRAIGARIEARAARIADLIDEARWLEERREFAEVLERVAAVLELDPDNVMALRHRAMAQFMQAFSAGEGQAAGLRQRALEDVARVVAARPDAAWPHAIKAYMLAEMKRDGAESEAALAERLRSATPSDEEIREEARLAQARNQPQRALALYSELIRRHPDSVLAISSRALIQEDLGDRDGAYIDYRVAVGLDPDYDLALIDLARMSADRGKLEDAESYLDQALRIDPENAIAFEIRGQILAQQGRLAKQQGDIEAARRLLEQAAQATRAGLAASSGLKWAELNLATITYELARLDERTDPQLISQALEGYRRVLERFAVLPEKGQDRDVYVAGLVNTCDAQIELRRLQEALATCSRIAELLPDNAVAFYNLAAIYTLMGRKDDALDALERDVELGDADWKYLRSDPWFEDLHGDVRFEALLSRMKGGAS